MKSQLSLNELAQKLTEQQKKDVIVDTSNVKFKITGQDQHGSGRVFGSTTLNYTTLTIMRVGDT